MTYQLAGSTYKTKAAITARCQAIIKATANLIDTKPMLGYYSHVAPHWASGTGILKTERTSAQSKRFFVASAFYGGCHGGSSERRSSVLSCQPYDIRHHLTGGEPI